MPFGMNVGLSPGDFVLDGDPVPLPKKEAEPPIFSPCLLWPNAWMDQDATWYGGRLRPGDFVLDGELGTQPPSQKEPPNFRPIFIVDGWMDEDAAWYGSRPRPRPHCRPTRRGPSSRERGINSSPLFSAHVYCGTVAHLS